MLERIGTRTAHGRSLFVVEASRPDDITAQLLAALPGEHFACLIAWDTEVGDEAEIARLAQTLLRAGAAYVCAWGEGCDRVHDIVDVEHVAMSAVGGTEPDVMTTWHAHDPLADALWHLLFSASPGPAYQASCAASVAISIGSAERAREMREALIDPAEFSERLMG